MTVLYLGAAIPVIWAILYVVFGALERRDQEALGTQLVTEIEAFLRNRTVSD